MTSSLNDRKIRDVRDIWSMGRNSDSDKENPRSLDNSTSDNRTKHKYKTLERHLSMKKTIRKKMMRDLREIGDASTETSSSTNSSQSPQITGFLEQIKNDQPPPANIDKPSLWKRLTKGWSHWIIIIAFELPKMHNRMAGQKRELIINIIYANLLCIVCM